MTKYETSNQGVRDCYSLNAETNALSPERAERFDVWLAGVKADAWQEGWNGGAEWPQNFENPYRGEQA